MWYQHHHPDIESMQFMQSIQLMPPAVDPAYATTGKFAQEQVNDVIDVKSECSS
jgi:hypothetical protein